jgi:hypothetical protein
VKYLDAFVRTEDRPTLVGRYGATPQQSSLRALG